MLRKEEKNIKGNMFKKGLVIFIIALIIGVGIQPVFADEPKILSNVKKEENTNPKEYLFQTIIDIANNPEVKDLLEQYEDDLLKVDIDKSMLREIILRNPRLLSDLLFTKPSFTPEYLDSMYNEGCQIINILGKDEAKKITESVTYDNPEFFNKLNNILLYNEDLSNRMEILAEMNKELNHNPLLWDWEHPIICASLAVLLFTILIIGGITFLMIYSIGLGLSKLPIWDKIWKLYEKVLWSIFGIYLYAFVEVLILGVQLDCWGPFDFDPYL